MRESIAPKKDNSISKLIRVKILQNILVESKSSQIRNKKIRGSIEQLYLHIAKYKVSQELVDNENNIESKGELILIFNKSYNTIDIFEINVSTKYYE